MTDTARYIATTEPFLPDFWLIEVDQIQCCVVGQIDTIDIAYFFSLDAPE